ncbi:hypothetical protein ACFPRL_21100 [Pseudoclavibacter helvolus]
MKLSTATVPSQYCLLTCVNSIIAAPVLGRRGRTDTSIHGTISARM